MSQKKRLTELLVTKTKKRPDKTLSAEYLDQRQPEKYAGPGKQSFQVRLSFVQGPLPPHFLGLIKKILLTLGKTSRKKFLFLLGIV